MKRLFANTIFIVLLLFAVSLYAEESASTAPAGNSKASPPSLYVKTLYISKIYPHNLGYKVNYWTSEGSLETTYVPITWFGTTSGKGEIVSEWGKSIPYMDIVFADGKFKLVRLHLIPTFYDVSWGSLNDSVDISDKFKVDTLNVQY